MIEKNGKKDFLFQQTYDVAFDGKGWKCQALGQFSDVRKFDENQIAIVQQNH